MRPFLTASIWIALTWAATLGSNGGPAGGAAFAEPPRVVKLEPADGATEVDPNLRFIRVEFDQDMREGNHSWVGGGETFPELRGMPYWEGPRVAVLPVRLDADKSYALGVNSDTFHGFQSVAGEAATPAALQFRTGAARPAPPLAVTVLLENAAAVPVLRRTFEQWYAYLGRRNIDWDKAFDEYEARLTSAVSPMEFARMAGELLAKAEDLHIWLTYGKQTFGSHSRSIPPNASLEFLQTHVPKWAQPSRYVITGRFADDIGYLMINAWSPGPKGEDTVAAVLAALDEMQAAPALVIDVRGNSGGDEMLAQRVAGCFIEQPTVYAKHRLRDPFEKGGYGPVCERGMKPTEGHERFKGKVAVLMGKYCMSSNESFLLMMKQVPGCVLVGERSYGSSGNPKGHGLPNGVVVYLPSWQDMTVDGKTFEGRGIAPDVEVKAEPSEFKERDRVLEAALAHLRR